MAATARHETRALLRAHLSAASGHPHRTKHCPVCHRLLRLASASEPDPEAAGEPTVEIVPESAPQGRPGPLAAPEDQAPSPA